VRAPWQAFKADRHMPRPVRDKDRKNPQVLDESLAIKEMNVDITAPRGSEDVWQSSASRQLLSESCEQLTRVFDLGNLFLRLLVVEPCTQCNQRMISQRGEMTGFLRISPRNLKTARSVRLQISELDGSP
jgi:hypothetical protein